MREDGIETPYAVHLSFDRDPSTISSLEVIHDDETDAVIGVRAIYDASHADADAVSLSTLRTEANLFLAALGAAGRVEASSRVVAEMWGGKGHRGGNKKHIGGTCGSAGSAGDRGYATTVLSFSGLQGFAPDGDHLNVYVGIDASDSHKGGSASILIGRAITDTLPADPASARVIGIGAGGGGGDADFNGFTCQAGYAGGSGAIAMGTTSGAVGAAGERGAKEKKGRGGNENGNGDGGDSKGSGTQKGLKGQDGIGGGSVSDSGMWPGTAISSSGWTRGLGGRGGYGRNTNAGNGGGGYGGGGGGSGGSGDTTENNHNGGGGGGGGWVTQAIASLDDVSDWSLDHAYDPGMPLIVLSFEAVAN